MTLACDSESLCALNKIQEAAPELIRALEWIYVMAFDVPEIRARAGMALEFAGVEFKRLPCKTD